MSSRLLVATTLALTVTAVGPAHAYAVGPPVALTQLAKDADFIGKATAISDRPIPDSWFAPVPGFEVRETDLRVVTIVKGTAGTKRIAFRHYAPKPGPIGTFAPQSFTLALGKSFLVFAAREQGDVYRQLASYPTQGSSQGVLLATDAKPNAAKTATDAAWIELAGLLTSHDPDEQVEAITALDELSGGHDSKLTDFERTRVLAAIQPTIAAPTESVATAAIAVFGADSPYLRDDDAPYWFAGLGKGDLPGLGGRTLTATPIAANAVTELVGVATGHGSAAVRALAIRALGGTHKVTRAQLDVWTRDPDPLVRRAGVELAAEATGDGAIDRAVTDADPQVRRAAALAIGFHQDAALVAALSTLLADKAPEVREAAALALLAFAPAQTTTVMKAHLTSEFRSLFVNTLARRDPQPYLAALAETIETNATPSLWWGGGIPASESWRILFLYLVARKPAELTAGTFDRSLTALEHATWWSSSEPQQLYALYVTRGLTARAKRLRTTVKKTFTDIDTLFDQVDQRPASFLP